MCMFDRRVHLLLDRERYERISAAARTRKVSVAEVVREAIDVAYPPRWPDRIAAGDAILAARPMEVPASVADLKTEIDEAHRRST
jgi:hypothetical protein